MNRVGRSVVSAITQTPASGPFALVTTPPRSLAPTWIAGSVDCSARSPAGQAVKTTAMPTVTKPEYKPAMGAPFSDVVEPTRARHDETAFMSRSRATRATSRKTRAPRKTRVPQIASAWPRSPSGRRALQAMLAAPPAIRILAGAVVVLAVWSAANWGYQVTRKPTELFFPLSSALTKAPPETWREFGPLFREDSTAVMAPELLAALAQVEGGGNPVARTYWRWRLTWNPFGLYQPASSAVGMYQITNATFREARRYCIHNHVAVEDGPWYDVRSCWFNRLYTRVMPSHAVELTAALLDRSVADTVERQRIATATLQQKQDLAAVVHLCGAGRGDARSEEHTSELQSRGHLVCRLLLEKKKEESGPWRWQSLPWLPSTSYWES